MANTASSVLGDLLQNPYVQSAGIYVATELSKESTKSVLKSLFKKKSTPTSITIIGDSAIRSLQQTQQKPSRKRIQSKKLKKKS